MKIDARGDEKLKIYFTWPKSGFFVFSLETCCFVLVFVPTSTNIVKTWATVVIWQQMFNEKLAYVSTLQYLLVVIWGKPYRKRAYISIILVIKRT